MTYRAAAAILFVLTAGVPAAAENVHMSSGFETGKIQSLSGNVDAFFVTTLPNPQSGSEVISTGAGGGSPSSNWDSKVVREYEGVGPRRGNFFARSKIFYNKNYTGLNEGLRKPRTALSLPAEEHRYNFDEEGWLGVSVFVPGDFEDELGRIGSAGSIEVIVSNTDSSAYFFNINIFVPQGESESFWVLQYVVDDKNVENQAGARINVPLAPVSQDKGKWTDFVIRFRSNPFAKATNPAQQGIKNANNKRYEGNKGILQIWKSQGAAQANGERNLVRKFSIENAPVGQVPGTTQGKSLLHFGLRTYKYGWQRENTSVNGPIWLGFDEFRYGMAQADGTRYADVHPTGAACTDRCPSGTGGTVSDVNRPKSPGDLVVVQQ